MNRKWKADEMEMSINFKAMRLSWVFVTAALLVWCVIELVVYGDTPFIPFIILCGQNIIFFSAKLIMTNKVSGKGSSEEDEK